MLYQISMWKSFLNTNSQSQPQSQFSITVLRKDMMGVKISAGKLEGMTNQKRKKCQEDLNDIII